MLMSADSLSIAELQSRTSSGPAHLNLYHQWPTGPSITVTDSCSLPVDGMDFLLWDTDIMTSDGEVVNILLPEINTHTHTHRDQSVRLLSYRRRRRSITLWMEDEYRRVGDWLFPHRGTNRDSKTSHFILKIQYVWDHFHQSTYMSEH